MRQFFFLFILCTPFFAIAQSGIINYSETMSFKIEAEDIEVKGMETDAILSMLSSEQKTKTVLLFTKEKSLYKTVKEAAATNKEDESGFIIKMDTPEAYIYYDAKEKITYNAQNFFNRDFIVVSESGASNWKISNEQKMIKDYLCLKATQMDEDSSEVVIWFVPQIQVDAAPGGITNVPGLVLEAELNKGQLKIEVTDINLESVNEKEITQPTKGKKVTGAKFKKIMNQKMKEMSEEMGGEGNIIIISN